MGKGRTTEWQRMFQAGEIAVGKSFVGMETVSHDGGSPKSRKQSADVGMRDETLFLITTLKNGIFRQYSAQLKILFKDEEVVVMY